MTESEIRSKTRRSFLVGGATAAAGLGGFLWLRSRDADNGVQWPLRAGLKANEGLWRTVSSSSRMAHTFRPDEVQEPRINGMIGLEETIPDDWMLRVDGFPGDTLQLPLDAVKSFEKVEMITELKCIEGWRRIVKWGGTRFSDFAAKYAPGVRSPYVALETPPADYYVGLEMESMMHPQTLLCYEMNGKPLELEHGAPLRLVAPIKYGIKNLKRIGRISFTETPPPDYWAERGYDYYSGF